MSAERGQQGRGWLYNWVLHLRRVYLHGWQGLVPEQIRIFISAGEASGDNYGALILQALRERQPATAVFGCAGARLAEAGCEAVVDAATVTMVGLVEVLPGLPRAWRALQSLKRAIRERRPTLAILVDFPDFNLRLARRIKRLGIPVVYYVAPQIWAWRSGRMRTIQQLVDQVLVIFPFEARIYERAGVPVQFVGHPLVGEEDGRISEIDHQLGGVLGLREHLLEIAGFVVHRSVRSGSGEPERDDRQDKRQHAEQVEGRGHDRDPVVVGIETEPVRRNGCVEADEIGRAHV